MIRQFSLLLLRPLVLRGVALAAAAAGVLALCVGLPGLRSGLEESSADPLWRLVVSRPHEQERRVVLVDIDENSLARAGVVEGPGDDEWKAVGVGSGHVFHGEFAHGVVVDRRRDLRFGYGRAVAVAVDVG